MKRGIWMLATLFGLMAGLGEAKAEVIYSQPLSAKPASQYGFYSGSWDSGSGLLQAEANGFRLASSAVVTKVQWWGAYQNGTTGAGFDHFLVTFYADSGCVSVHGPRVANV